MPHVIHEENCVGCGVCAETCPTRSIERVEETGKYRTNPYYCIDCGACAMDCCVDAITEEPLGDYRYEEYRAYMRY